MATTSSDVLFACKCLNVQIKVHQTASLDASLAPSDKEQDDFSPYLDADVQLPKGTAPDISVAQPLMTTRFKLSPNTDQGEGRTGLACSNCRTNVYAVDKVNPSNPPNNPRLVGFTTTQNAGQGSKTTEDALERSLSPGAAQRTGEASESVESILQPATGTGSIWILAGCLKRAEIIRELSTSVDYSTTYGMLIDKAKQNGDREGSRDRKPSDTSNDDERSPARSARSSSIVSLRPKGHALLASTARSRSSASPSPARRRRKAALAEEEEEGGDDLDTLHLLETLLPHLPSSLLREAAKYSGDGAASRRTTTGYSASSAKSPEKPSANGKQLEAKLESQALAVLRAKREEAQRAIYNLLKEKSKELSITESTLRDEARQLRDNAQRHANSSRSEQQRGQDRLDGTNQAGSFDGRGRAGADAELQEPGVETGLEEGESGSPLFVRRRPLVPAMEKTSSQDSMSKRRQPSGAVGVPGREGSSSLNQTSQGTPIGSYLSASFAMRGRDLPDKAQEEQRSKEDEEDWFAHKKRLRERYPHADHSALPSAVNSDDEGAVEVKQNSKSAASSPDSDDDERRGRGRGRAGSQHVAATTQRTPTPPRRDITNGQSRLQAKSSKDDGAEELSQSSRTVRGALKGGVTASDSRSTPNPEKKVAFASTTEEREVETSHSGDDEQVETMQSTEPGEALFEIDEDLDADEITPNSSDITLDGRSAALQQGTEDLVNVALQDERVDFDDDNEDFDPALNPEASVARSMPIAGSFSAMAESEMRRIHASRDSEKSIEAQEDEANFDPASLRFDGRGVYISGENLRSTSSTGRSTSSQDSIPTSLSHSNTQRQRISKDARQALLAGFPSEPLERSAIGFRVIVGEAEARLSGLLAPHAPSHRDLYSTDHKRKGGSRKYKLEGVDEEEGEDEFAEDEGEESKDKKSKGTLKDHTQGKGKISNDTKPRNVAIISSRFGKLDEKSLDPSMLARSVPINAPNMARLSSSTIHRDASSGFDLEPKTSLPYQEKHLTPSLRKAMRQNSSHRSSFGGLSNLSEATSASGEPSENGNDVVPGRPPTLSRQSSASQIAGVEPIGILGAKSKTGQRDQKAPEFKYAVPASVTRGFEMSSSGATSPIKDSDRAISAQQPFMASNPPTPHLIASPLLGSSADRDRSGSRVRSPRVPYTPPPPPATIEVRLDADAKHKPAPFNLSAMDVADDHEEGDLEDDVDGVLEFMHVVEKLKTNKRTGWYHHRIEQPESIADHMYRMGLLSMLLSDRNLDIGKCVQLCLVHDLAEALVGDLTPLDGVSGEEKLRREKEAITHLVHNLLSGSRAALRIQSLWDEYEDRQSPESLAVKDLDRFELALQAVEYERRYGTNDLQPFYDGSTGKITLPRVQRWIRRLAKERESLWSTTEYAYTQTMPDDPVRPA